MFIKNIFTKARKNKSEAGSIDNLLKEDSPTRLSGRVTIQRGKIILVLVFGVCLGIVHGWIRRHTNLGPLAMNLHHPFIALKMPSFPIEINI